jgi:hypothetical protein
MDNHLFIPGICLSNIQLLPEHRIWLTDWLQSLERQVGDKSIAASECLQGALTELAVSQSIKTDWTGIMDAYLLNEGSPLAYSEAYGKRLYKFNKQWPQTPIHCIHARWWIERICTKSNDSIDYGGLIESFIQPNGWIYNPLVSKTRTQTRMKSEYMMSFTMGLEILHAYDLLEKRREALEAVISSEPTTVFLSAESFRQKSLEILGVPELAPINFHSILTICKLEEGFCDFSVREKRDDYMGTLKRVTRDVAVHSPLSALHAHYISTFCTPEIQEEVSKTMRNIATHLKSNPLAIKSFKIRDLVDVPFGTDISPIELIAASSIVQNFS